MDIIYILQSLTIKKTCAYEKKHAPKNELLLILNNVPLIGSVEVFSTGIIRSGTSSL